jgi:PAS domain S-box-containing protein
MDVLKIAGLALAYFLAHCIAFLFPDSEKVIMLVWPAGGIGLAAFLLNPRRLWPALTIAFYISGIAADVLIAGCSLMTGIGYMTGNMVESIGCAWLILYWAGDFRKFTQLKEILALIVGTVFINALSSCIGAGTSVLTRGVPFIESWQSWYIAAGLGIFVVGPFIVAWIGVKEAIAGLRFKKMIEGAAFIAIWSLLTLLIFRTYEINNHIVFRPYLLIGPLAWVALRLGQRGVTLAMVLLFAIALFSPAIVNGPSPWTEPEEGLSRRLLDLQEFLGFGAVVGYLLAASRADRNRAEEKLRESETRFRILFEEGMDGLLLADLETKKFHVANPQICRMLGYSADELKLLVIPDIHLAENLPQVMKAIAAQVKGETQTAMGMPIRRKDGSIFYADIIAKPITIDGRRYLLGIFHDVTERKKMQEAILREQKLSENLINSSIDGIHAYDRQCRYIMWNPGMERISGKKKEDVLGRCAFDVFPFLKETGGDKYFYDALAGKTIIAKKRQYKMPETGKQGFFEGCYSPMYDEQNNIIGGLAIVRDITEITQSEKEIQETQERVQAIIDNTPSLVYIKDLEGRLQLVNRKFESLFGLPGKELVGKTSYDLMSKEVADTHRSADLEVMAKRAGVSVEEVNDEPDGRHTYLSNKFPLFDTAGKIYGICGISTDITERKRAEELLRENEERYRDLFESSIEGIGLSKGNQVLDANPALLGIFGYDNLEEFKKIPLLEHVAPESRSFIDDKRRKIQRGELTDNRFEYRIIRKDGQTRDLEISVKHIQIENDTYALSTFRDITERKQAEQKILEYQNRLKMLAIQLTLVEEQERRRIAGQLHDEVSQTLAMAKIKLDLLRSSPPSEASPAEMEQISSYIEKVILETRTLTFELSNSILYEVGFEAAVEDWLNENIQKKHGIATEFYDDELPKPLDDDLKTMLFRDVRELLNNCIKHAKAGKIMVSLRRINDSIEVTVEDNGVGFDSAQIKTKTGKKATYGLFSIRENIENAGGRFEIQSGPGVGCKAIMAAPLKDQINKKEV